jgi:hypothetical protein
MNIFQIVLTLIFYGWLFAMLWLLWAIWKNTTQTMQSNWTMLMEIVTKTTETNKVLVERLKLDEPDKP